METSVSPDRKSKYAEEQTFTVAIATDNTTKLRVMHALGQMGRQTANLRLMPTAELLVVSGDSKEKQLIAWLGLDYRHQPGTAELFSLYVNPDYRGYHLSTVLHHLAAEYLTSKHLHFALIRMDAIGTRSLLESRLASGYWKMCEPKQITSEIVGLCHNCELYDRSCRAQAYLYFDLDSFHRRAEHKVGNMGPTVFPKRIRVKNGSFTYVTSK
jgi:hypothetical protein